MTEKYIISGLVQGIGFRPSVKRAAERNNVSGTVKNIGGAVEIIACGAETALNAFRAEIKNIPKAVITEFIQKPIDGFLADGFTIIQSLTAEVKKPLITPDMTVCERCMEEFYDPHNRRYKHPFISCTDCGPRYSVLCDIPYDRENITMSEFTMCQNCRSEYGDIGDIRCHAQTIACNDCGPELFYTSGGENPLDEAVKTINNGGVVAVKDIGGYHFACSAFSQTAVLSIREIKGREAKPFAVMFNSINDIYQYAEVSKQEKDLLQSDARPITLLRRKADFAPAVCADSGDIGAFLPCNPVQYYLTEKCGALVMTSANISGSPIITDDADMIKLREKAGGFEILSHNRRIATPLDDSVCRVICGKNQIIRRARGYVPLPVEINAKKDKTVLAAGGDLKASFCYGVSGSAYMSQHFGDLENGSVYEEWQKNIDRLGRLLGIGEAEFVSDIHAGYHSANYKNGIRIQHHFAHMASVMAEHKIDGDALGFVFDGTGMGTDGCIWGGEVIRYRNGFNRILHLEYTELLGGDESSKSSELTLDCFLYSAGLPMRSENAAVIEAALKNHINTAKSSSMGRLFDAASALLGISAYNSYEGESAILLENAASKAKESYPLKLICNGGTWETSELIRQIAIAYERGADKHSLALGFHTAIANAVCDYAKSQSIKEIILSGGVFANRILTELCFDGLTKSGYNVYINEQVPCNDGGIALGQAWCALN